LRCLGCAQKKAIIARQRPLRPSGIAKWASQLRLAVRSRRDRDCTQQNQPTSKLFIHHHCPGQQLH